MIKQIETLPLTILKNSSSLDYYSAYKVRRTTKTLLTIYILYESSTKAWIVENSYIWGSKKCVIASKNTKDKAKIVENGKHW